MPSGNSFLFAALTGYLLLLTIQVVGLTEYSRFFRKRNTSQVFLYGLYIIVLIIQVPLVYWLLFYKSVALVLSNQLWKFLWIISALCVSSLIVAGFAVIIKKVHNKFRKSNKQNDYQPNESRREFLTLTTYTGIGIISSSTLMLSQDSTTPIVEHVTMSFKNLPLAFDGTTIGILSDIHSSPFMPKAQIAEYTASLMSLQCDLVMLPGDFINSRTEEVFPCIEALQGIHAPLGVWAVTGNHDYFSKQVERVVFELEQTGIRFLRNEHTAIRKGSDSISLMGIDDEFSNTIGKYVIDGFTHEKAVESMLSNGKDYFKLMMCHKPYRFQEYSAVGIDCMISGHTHGGQIVAMPSIIPGGISFSRFASPYVSGLYTSVTNNNSIMYVTRGVGSVGIPIRYNAKPEITKITLQRI